MDKMALRAIKRRIRQYKRTLKAIQKACNAYCKDCYLKVCPFCHIGKILKITEEQERICGCGKGGKNEIRKIRK